MQELFGRSSRNPGGCSGAATEARLLAPAVAIFAGIAQIESKSLQDFSGKFLEMQDDIHRSRKLAPALIAGLIAIVVNTAMLEAADWIQLVTARGGLLKLLKIYFASPLAGLGVADLWAALHLPAADTHFQDRVSHPRRAAYGAILSFRARAHSLGTGDAQGPFYALLVWLPMPSSCSPGSMHCRQPLFERGRDDVSRDSPHRLFRAACAAICELHAMKTRRRAPMLLTSGPDWAAFIASLFAPAPREKPRWNPS